MPDTNFDLLIIGSGPGGYVAAIRAAQLGLKTGVVEKDAYLGGTCLNVGCIPSKALLHSTEQFHFASHRAAEHGIVLDSPKIDVGQLMKRKTGVVEKLRGGIGQLLKARQIEVFNGTGSLAGGGRVEVRGDKGEQTLEAKHILIATGSSTVELPFLPFDGKTVVGSDEAIAFDSVPKKLAVVGAGAIGLELGSVWARLGSEVTVVEFLPRVAPTFDHEISRAAERIFRKQGLEFHLGTKVTGLKKGRGQARAKLTAEKDGKAVEIEADRILVAVGRKPNTAGLEPEAAGIELDEKGRIPVDRRFRTKAEGVYAIGDVIAGPMLAHKAEEEGVACVERIAGQAGHVNYDVIPNVVYTDPEIASVGLGEQDAKEKGIEVRIGKFPFAANGRALASDATDGFAKVVADAKTDRLLGVQVIARGASELIAAAVAHMEYGGSAEDLGRTVHAHPTLSEALKEAALAAGEGAIHAV